MQILKNFKILKTGGVEEFPSIEIRYSDSEVFINLPICAVDFGPEIEDPVLIGYNQAGIASVIAKQDLLVELNKTKKIFFKLDETGSPLMVDEVTDITTRLPKDMNEDELIFDYKNGQIFVIEKENKEEE